MKDKQKKLVKLGADALAIALLDLAQYSEDADAVVERLLASPKESAKSFKRRLSSIKRRRHFVSWGESGAYARELADLLRTLADSAPDPKAGVESVAAFYEADAQIFDQCDDSSGNIGDVFKFDAADLFVSFASRCEDKEWLLELVITLNQIDEYGVRDVLFERMSQFLPETLVRKAVDRLCVLVSSEVDKYESKHWLFAIEDLAKQLKDPQLLEKAKRAESSGDLPVASLIDIARLEVECGHFEAALSWIEQVPLTESFKANERDDLLISIYQAQNDSKKLSETAWRVFRRDRDIVSFEQLLTIIGEEKRASVLQEEAKAILEAAEFDSGDAEFLIETGRIDDAESYIIAHAQQLNGDFYTSILELAKAMLKHNRLVAASVLHRELLNSILARAKSKNYHHGVNYLKKLNSLAQKISEWKNVESHTSYLANLRQKHKLKSSFWSQYDA